MKEKAEQTAGDKRLYIDLDICDASECRRACTIECSYLYHTQPPVNNGIFSLAELATYALVCRRCEEPHCVNSCPVQALEQISEDKLLVRHNMRCISCRSCSHACPYGTIYPEHLPQLNHHCDFCLDRRTDPNEPRCSVTCPQDAIKLVKGDEALGEDTYLVGEHLVVHSTHWSQDKA